MYIWGEIHFGIITMSSFISEFFGYFCLETFCCMLIWEKNIPTYLTGKTNIVRFVVFTAVFALIFINIYAPFGVENWYHKVTELQLFLYSSSVILLGMLVIVVSRILMWLISRKKELRRRGQMGCLLIFQFLSWWTPSSGVCFQEWLPWQRSWIQPW